MSDNFTTSQLAEINRMIDARSKVASSGTIGNHSALRNLTANTHTQYTENNGSDALACRVYASASITIADTTSTALTFTDERWDWGSFWSTASPTRLTPPQAGWYLIQGQLSWGNSGAPPSVRQTMLRVNGSTIIALTEQIITDTGGGSTGVFSQQASTLYYLTTTDYVELVVYHSTGDDNSVTHVDNYSPEFSIMAVK